MAEAELRLNCTENVWKYFRKSYLKQQGSHHGINGDVSPGRSRSRAPGKSDLESKCNNLGIIIAKPKYKRQGNLQSRIASFENWPSTKTQDRIELAKAGFTYTGVDDTVKCFHCGIGLKDWPLDACPWEQHVLASPTCGHVLQCKGKGYIRKVLYDERNDSDVEDSDDVVDLVSIAINRNTDAVAAARDFCSNEHILLTAIKSVIKHDIEKKFSAVELMECVEKIEESSIVSEATEQTDHGNTDADEKCKALDETDSNEDSSESDEDIEETNRLLKERVTCKICFDAIACILALPCGHMTCCSQCISALTKCAICRTEIKGTVRTVMAA